MTETKGALNKTPIEALHWECGILMCERMLYSRPDDVEAKIDARIEELKAKIEKRENATRAQAKGQ